LLNEHAIFRAPLTKIVKYVCSACLTETYCTHDVFSEIRDGHFEILTTGTLFVLQNTSILGSEQS